jgi:hypothetical protein
MDRQDHAQAGIYWLQLFTRQPQTDVIHPRTAEPRRQTDTQDAQLAQPLENPRDVLLFTVVRLDDRRYHPFGKIVHHPGDHFVFLSECRIHRKYRSIKVWAELLTASQYYTQIDA